MSQIKHTAGPWHYVQSNGTNFILTNENILIAEVDFHKDLKYITPTPEAQTHNSKLIVAAPKMLDALEYAVELIKGLDLEGGAKYDEKSIGMLPIINAIKSATS